MDIVVLTHLPASSRINKDKFNQVIEMLVRAVHPDAETVAFAQGTENRQGINVVQIKTALNKATKDDLESALAWIFGQEFEISYTREQSFLNRGKEILHATSQFASHRN